VAVASSDSPGAILRELGRIRPQWIFIGLAFELIAYAGYVFAYRSSAHLSECPPLPLRLTITLVVAGFGPFVTLGGFALDREALTEVHGDERAARVHVLSLGVVEYALLAPAAWLCALLLLLETRHASLALTLPWILAVPPGFALAILIASPKRVERWQGGSGRLRALRGDMILGIHVLRRLALTPAEHPGAIIGMGLYWAAEIACLGAALACFGVHIGVPALVLAHATGYAASRRSLPLGGAGITEALLTLALIWVHVPAPAALMSVVVYRLANFVAPSIPALIAHGSIRHLLAARREAARRAGRATKRSAQADGET
jgi:uncharacterized membrane protein YbhN (UPF0104 family)